MTGLRIDSMKNILENKYLEVFWDHHSDGVGQNEQLSEMEDIN